MWGCCGAKNFCHCIQCTPGCHCSFLKQRELFPFLTSKGCSPAIGPFISVVVFDPTQQQVPMLSHEAQELVKLNSADPTSSLWAHYKPYKIIVLHPTYFFPFTSKHTLICSFHVFVLPRKPISNWTRHLWNMKIYCDYQMLAAMKLSQDSVKRTLPFMTTYCFNDKNKLHQP